MFELYELTSECEKDIDMSEKSELDNEFKAVIREKMAITLEVAVSKLGFMPDACGDMVKDILKTCDSVEMMSMGCILDDCIKNKSYKLLPPFLDEIKERRKQGSNSIPL